MLPGTRATCGATYSNVLRTVDPAQVNHLLMDLLTRVRAEKREAGERVHVVLDGKTLRGTQHHLAPHETLPFSQPLIQFDKECWREIPHGGLEESSQFQHLG